MASPEKVKQYLACWFQLGKKLLLDTGETIVLSEPAVRGDRYSAEFEACWQKIMAQEGKHYYLEGTESTIDLLLSPAWEIVSCARCSMPIPRIEIGMQALSCPCTDLPSWPNFELPMPRPPVNSNSRMDKIRNRLTMKRN